MELLTAKKCELAGRYVHIHKREHAYVVIQYKVVQSSLFSAIMLRVSTKLSVNCYDRPDLRWFGSRSIIIHTFVSICLEPFVG